MALLFSPCLSALYSTEDIPALYLTNQITVLLSWRPITSLHCCLGGALQSAVAQNRTPSVRFVLYMVHCFIVYLSLVRCECFIQSLKNCVVSTTPTFDLVDTFENLLHYLFVYNFDKSINNCHLVAAYCTT